MLLLARYFDWEACISAVLLSLRVRPRVLDTLDRLDTLCLGTLVVAPWSGRDPLVLGRYSFAGGRLKSSIAYFGNGFWGT